MFTSWPDLSNAEKVEFTTYASEVIGRSWEDGVLEAGDLKINRVACKKIKSC
jgi:hypothetical protein